MARLAVLGAGSWGTALAILLARNGHELLLWGHRREQVERLRVERCNRRYLPGVAFPERLEPCAELRTAVQDTDIQIIAVPSHGFRGLLDDIRPYLTRTARIAWVTKGLELGTGRLLHEVARDILGATVSLAVLSGPTFAGEVAANLPTAITVASEPPDFADTLVGLLRNARFRAYTSTDIIGVQLGGATKNVLAIAAGVADGLGFGANARAALITRGLAEMIRLGLNLGGKPETFTGLAGLGDLILTSTDDQSRNRRFGLGLGRGERREDIIAGIGQEIEGIATTRIVQRLARERGVEMPITEQIHKILYEDLPPLEAVNNLLLREPRSEVLR